MAEAPTGKLAQATALGASAAKRRSARDRGERTGGNKTLRTRRPSADKRKAGTALAHTTPAAIGGDADPSRLHSLQGAAWLRIVEQPTGHVKPMPAVPHRNQRPIR